MAVEVEMPQLSDTMEKGTIVRWLKDEGDEVERGDVLAEVETDKATMDLEAFDDGVLLKRLAEEGEDVPTQTLIAVIGREGEDISGILSDAGADDTDTATETDQPDESDETAGEPEPSKEPSFEETPESTPTPQVEEEPTEPEPPEEPEPEPDVTTTTVTEDKESTTAQPEPTDGDGSLRVSPVARRIAANNRIDLYQLEGSGPEGRIVKKDVEEAMKKGTAQLSQGGSGSLGQSATSPLKQETRKLSGMRKTIAERMAQSKRNAPHFYLTREIDMERVTEIRDELNDSGDEVEFSYNDFVMTASARALCEVPEVNGSYQEDHIQLYDRVDLGFAVAVDDGLFTPVISNAEEKSIGEIHDQSQTLIQKARDGELTPDDYQGGTFTISNLGMFDISNFTAVINPPQAAILAVGAVDEKPVVEDGDLAVGTRMEVTLSCDHRAIDGVHGSRYLQELADLLEHPVRLIA